MEIEHLTKQVESNTKEIVNIRIELSTFKVVKMIVFAGAGLMLSTLFSGMIGAGIYILIQQGA